jgi:hypothetical protein
MQSEIAFVSAIKNGLARKLNLAANIASASELWG